MMNKRLLAVILAGLALTGVMILAAQDRGARVGYKDTIVVAPLDTGAVIGSDARTGDAASDATTKKPTSSDGCSCNVGSAHSQAPGGLVAFLLVGAMLLVRRSRRTK